MAIRGGVDHKEAKISLARKIAALCLCLLKNNDTFKNDFDHQQKERTRLRKKLNLGQSILTPSHELN